MQSRFTDTKAARGKRCTNDNRIVKAEDEKSEEEELDSRIGLDVVMENTEFDCFDVDDNEDNEEEEEEENGGVPFSPDVDENVIMATTPLTVEGGNEKSCGDNASVMTGLNLKTDNDKEGSGEVVITHKSFCDNEDDDCSMDSDIEIISNVSTKQSACSLE